MADDQLRVGEAGMERSEEGLRPVGEGRFVVNVAELATEGNDRMGISCSPEPDDARFPEFGFNLRVLRPGQLTPVSAYSLSRAGSDCFARATSSTVRRSPATCSSEPATGRARS